MVFLDSAPVIYFVEQPPEWGAIASARILELKANGEELAVSDLVRMECRVHPLKHQDTARLELFDTFFASTDIRVLAISADVCDRAALIRANYGFKPLDSLQLAAAVAFGCTRFLTNDNRLDRFSELTVEVWS